MAAGIGQARHSACYSHIFSLLPAKMSFLHLGFSQHINYTSYQINYSQLNCFTKEYPVTALLLVFAIKRLIVSDGAVRVAIPAWAGDWPFSQTVQTGSGAQPASLSTSTVASTRDRAAGA